MSNPHRVRRQIHETIIFGGYSRIITAKTKKEPVKGPRERFKEYALRRQAEKKGRTQNNETRSA